MCNVIYTLFTEKTSVPLEIDCKEVVQVQHHFSENFAVVFLIANKGFATQAESLLELQDLEDLIFDPISGS